MDFLGPAFTWLHDHPRLLTATGVFSAVAFFGTLLLLPFLIIRIPEDYFLYNKKPELPSGHPVIRMLARAGKNFLGGVLILVGLVMLVLPGQGLLTILIGLALIEFPGKRKVECWFIRKKPVLGAANYIRAKAKRPPFKIDLSQCAPPSRP